MYFHKAILANYGQLTPQLQGVHYVDNQMMSFCTFLKTERQTVWKLCSIQDSIRAMLFNELCGTPP